MRFKMAQQVFFVGTYDEVAHHAAPLAGQIDYQIIDADSVINVANPGDLAIFYSEHFDRFRNAIRLLKQKQVATLYMIDGIIEWRNAWENEKEEPACPFTMRPILAHKAACIGPAQARLLDDWGNRGKTEVVGAPRLDRLFSHSIQESSSVVRRVLVMTAKCPAFTGDQRQRLIQSLIDLKERLHSRQGIESVWRMTDGLENELKVENVLNDLTGQDLFETLQTVDVVITTPSTAAIEAMALEKPTAILDYNNSPTYMQSAWRITAPDHIEDVVQELLNPPKPKLLFQNQLLCEEICTDGNATERMCELISSMLESSLKSINRQSELSFPVQMLETVVKSPATFDHSEVFSDFAEFENSELLELQTELAHARREIKYLHAQLEQIRAELGHAHAIFDEINNHPVAGPIVRIRQKIFDLIAKLKRRTTQPEPN